MDTDYGVPEQGDYLKVYGSYGGIDEETGIFKINVTLVEKQ
jgi:hypothetical protein